MCALLAIVLTGCQDGVAGVKRSLPPMPAVCATVPVPKISSEADARKALVTVAAAFLKANGHISACREWYDGVRKQYAEGA